VSADTAAAAAAATRLRITEIFHSLQGETSRVGLPTTFVRLTGCPLRCVWCDSAYAFTGGETWSIDRILTQVATHRTRYVCVTGGEPLAQRGAQALLAALCDAGYDVSLETSGAIDIAEVDRRVSRIVDLKAPGSGESAKNLFSNLALLRPTDELKVVIADRADYDWAKAAIDRAPGWTTCPILFAPVQDRLAPAELAQWILDDDLPVRFQLQLHKVLWGNVPGR
jgi:7-carboxy-7-deazaguanine synthase